MGIAAIIAVIALIALSSDLSWFELSIFAAISAVAMLVTLKLLRPPS
jgi:hypothetical protein